jgi:uncharacterized protein (TIGR03118 family)
VGWFTPFGVKQHLKAITSLNWAVACITHPCFGAPAVCVAIHISNLRVEEDMKMPRLAKSYALLVFALLLFPTLSFAQEYVQTNLVTDPASGASATTFDANLKNAWGLARSTTSPWWVSDNATGLSTIYSGAGVPAALVVKIPGPSGSPANFVASPTGIVSNGSTDFHLVAGDSTTAAKFIFVTEDGTISAWNAGTVAKLLVDNSAIPSAAKGAVYKGATIGEFEGKRYLYVANFRSGHIETYDTDFKKVTLSDGDHDRDDRAEEQFDDDRIPRSYAPFNVQNIGGSLFVAYAKQDKAKHDDVAGDGNGFVDIYGTSGKLQARLDHGPWFNSPWGAVWAPRDFGEFSNRVLIGNFGSGKIAAFNGFDGHFIGFMKDLSDNVIEIDGLWALAFGNSAAGCPAAPPANSGLPKCGSAGPYNSLFFTAGLNGEADGLFGTLTANAAEQDGDEE